MAITVVDKTAHFVVQKVSKPNGETIRYQVLPISSIGDSSAVMVLSSLAEARATIGKSQGGKLLTAKELAEAAFA